MLCCNSKLCACKLSLIEFTVPNNYFKLMLSLLYSMSMISFDCRYTWERLSDDIYIYMTGVVSIELGVSFVPAIWRSAWIDRYVRWASAAAKLTEFCGWDDREWLTGICLWNIVSKVMWREKEREKENSKWTAWNCGNDSIKWAYILLPGCVDYDRGRWGAGDRTNREFNKVNPYGLVGIWLLCSKRKLTSVKI